MNNWVVTISSVCVIGISDTTRFSCRTWRWVWSRRRIIFLCEQPFSTCRVQPEEVAMYMSDSDVKHLLQPFMWKTICRTMSVWILDIYVDVKHLLQPFGTIYVVMLNLWMWICEYICDCECVYVHGICFVFANVRFLNTEFCAISEICYVRRPSVSRRT
jgi:hypothetical protein